MDNVIRQVKAGWICVTTDNEPIEVDQSSGGYYHKASDVQRATFFIDEADALRYAAVFNWKTKTLIPKHATLTLEFLL